MDSRLNKPLAIARDRRRAGARRSCVGVATGIADRHLRRARTRRRSPAPSLESMRAQNRLIAFVARYVSVTSVDDQPLRLVGQADADPARRRPLRARPGEARSPRT